MGIFDTLREKSSHEEGIHFVDGKDRRLASFEADLTSGNGDSFTCDIEILRGELAGILYDVTKDDVEYIFGDMVESLEERESDIKVNFANSTPSTFELVVAADGIGSKIRSMTFGNDPSHINSLNAYVSYFSLVPGETDTKWARVHWYKGGRNISVRPDNQGRTRAFLCLTCYDNSDPRLPLCDKASKAGVKAQKALVQELFQDVDWESARLLKGMHESDDFYMQHVAQVKLDKWSKGRVALVGDAGFAPSPFTGMGTSIAFIGAYVLAGEISKQLDNIPAALESYERVLRPYVESIQKLPPGVPWIVNPQSALGVKVFETAGWIIGLLSKFRISKALSKAATFLPIGRDFPFKLPEYEAFQKEDASATS